MYEQVDDVLMKFWNGWFNWMNITIRKVNTWKENLPMSICHKSLVKLCYLLCQLLVSCIWSRVTMWQATRWHHTQMIRFSTQGHQVPRSSGFVEGRHATEATRLLPLKWAVSGEPCVLESGDLTTITFLQRKIPHIHVVVWKLSFTW